MEEHMDSKQSAWSSLVDFAYFVVVCVLGVQGKLTEHSLLTLLWIYAAGRFGTSMYKHALRNAAGVSNNQGQNQGGSGSGGGSNPPPGMPKVDNSSTPPPSSKPFSIAKRQGLLGWFRPLDVVLNPKVQMMFFALAMVVLAGCIILRSSQ